MEVKTPLSLASQTTISSNNLLDKNTNKLIPIPKKKENFNAEFQIDRLLGQVWRNPFDVLDLDKEATDEEVKKQFKNLSLLLHPDKCKDPRATDCFTIVEQSYKTLLDSEKRKIFQKIM